jgi:hypothetical protein
VSEGHESCNKKARNEKPGVAHLLSRRNLLAKDAQTQRERVTKQTADDEKQTTLRGGERWAVISGRANGNRNVCVCVSVRTRMTNLSGSFSAIGKWRPATQEPQQPSAIRTKHCEQCDVGARLVRSRAKLARFTHSLTHSGFGLHWSCRSDWCPTPPPLTKHPQQVHTFIPEWP